MGSPDRQQQCDYSDTGKSISVTEFKPQSGVTSVTGGELVVYPNPATDVINVKSDKGVASVEVYTLSGAKVAESDTDAVSGIPDSGVGMALGYAEASSWLFPHSPRGATLQNLW